MNTSRAAQFVALLLCAGLLAWPARRLLSDSWQTQPRLPMAALYLVLAGVAAAIILTIGTDAPLARWRTGLHAPGYKKDVSRWLAAGAGARAMPLAGWFGFRPGTFRVMFPYFTGYLGNRIPGLWRYQHEDYIQTVIEWGWLGAALWSGVYFGGVGLAARAYHRQAANWSGRPKFVASSVLLGTGFFGP